MIAARASSTSLARALAARFACGALLGCGAEPPPPPAEPPPPVEVRAEVDQAVATTGDVVTYRLEIEHDPGIELQMPEYGAEIAGFRIIDLGSEKVDLDGGRVEEARWFQLRADLVGSYVLPSATLRWRPEGTESWTEEQTSEIFVEVASVLPADGEATELRDIKPLQPRDDAFPWAAVGVAGAAVGVLALAGLALWRRSRSRPAPPPPLPHEVAFAALDRLRQVEVSGPEAARAWVFDLSEVLRVYVESRFGLNATDLTTEEILARATGLPDLGPERARLEGFLHETDAVKYAARVPTEGDLERSYEHALGFVEATVPAPEPAGAAAGAAA